MSAEGSVLPWLPLLSGLALKSLIVFLVAGVTLLTLRRASASARHLVCLLTLTALLALPILSLALPGWRLPVLLPASPAASAPVPSSSRAAMMPASAGTGATMKVVPFAPPSARLAPLLVLPPTAVPATPHPLPWGIVLPAFWLGGALLAILRPLLGLWGIARLSRDSEPVSNAPTLAVASECAFALSLSQTPALRQADAPVPMTWGWRRPVVLLPTDAHDWPDERLRAVLLHELAHIRRRDWLSHRFADVVCALYWFHPLAWLTARRLRAEGEIVCDDLVLTSGVAAPDYARHLLDVARALRPVSAAVPQAAIAMARTAHIEGRLKMILDHTRSRRALTRRALLLALVTSGIGAAALAALRPGARAAALPLRQTFANGAVLELVKVGAAPERPGRIGALAVTLQYAPQSQPVNAWTAPTLADNYLSRGRGIYVRKPDLITWAFKGPAPNLTPVRANAGEHQVTASYALSETLPAGTQMLDMGVAAGPWTVSIDCPKTPGKVRLARPSGAVIFTLNVHADQDGALLMVSDHLHTPSPLEAENLTQAAMHDIGNYERAVYALDGAGRILAELQGGSLVTPDAEGPLWRGFGEDPTRYKMMQTDHVSGNVLRRAASFRLVARPYQWAKFNVEAPR